MKTTFRPEPLCDSQMNVYFAYWDRVTHICVSKLTIIGSDNGLSPGRRQAIIWTNAGILLIGPLGTNFNETSIEIHTFSFKKIHLKLSSGKWRPFCLGLNVLNRERTTKRRIKQNERPGKTSRQKRRTGRKSSLCVSDDDIWANNFCELRNSIYQSPLLKRAFITVLLYQLNVCQALQHYRWE